jgi:Na+-transporting NADH:ubiquinone oxidoreductase subunit NqrD
MGEEGYGPFLGNLKAGDIVLIDPLVDNNPITLQVLGICSALAVTSSLKVATGDGHER